MKESNRGWDFQTLLAACGKSPDRPCARDLASAGKARRGGDGRASSTTSNAVRRRQTPGALWVAGGAHPSALLRLLDDAWASPASPRLLSGPAAPATRPIRLLPPAARQPRNSPITSLPWPPRSQTEFQTYIPDHRIQPATFQGKETGRYQEAYTHPVTGVAADEQVARTR